MNKYRVTVSIEGNGPPENDVEIAKIVMASSCDEAIARARDLVMVENPDLNYLKIWNWTPEKLYD